MLPFGHRRKMHPSLLLHRRSPWASVRFTIAGKRQPLRHHTWWSLCSLHDQSARWRWSGWCSTIVRNSQQDSVKRGWNNIVAEFAHAKYGLFKIKPQHCSVGERPTQAKEKKARCRLWFAWGFSHSSICKNRKNPRCEIIHNSLRNQVAGWRTLEWTNKRKVSQRLTQQNSRCARNRARQEIKKYRKLWDNGHQRCVAAPIVMLAQQKVFLRLCCWKGLSGTEVHGITACCSPAQATTALKAGVYWHDLKTNKLTVLLAAWRQNQNLNTRNSCERPPTAQAAFLDNDNQNTKASLWYSIITNQKPALDCSPAFVATRWLSRSTWHASLPPRMVINFILSGTNTNCAGQLHCSHRRNCSGGKSGVVMTSLSIHNKRRLDSEKKRLYVFFDWFDSSVVDVTSSWYSNNWVRRWR